MENFSLFSLKAAEWFENKWQDSSYLEGKKLSYKGIKTYIEQPPKRVLDIGCGMAFEAKMLQEEYGCELFLLDGDFKDHDNKRLVGYGSVSNMGFYTPLETLKSHWDEQGLDYTFVDAENIQIPDDTVFDLIMSNVSCGYHYPLDTYYDLISKHSNEETLLLFDIKTKQLPGQLGNKWKATGRFYYNKKASKYKLQLLDPTEIQED